MRTHFDNVGFAIPDRDHLTALIRRTAREGTPLDSPHGRYFRWAPGAGIELWAGVDTARELTAFNPHFWGPARMSVRIERLERDRQAPLTGAVHGVAVEASGEEIPISLDIPDFDFLAMAQGVVTFQVAAFAHELHVFPDEDAFASAGAGRASRSLERLEDPDSGERAAAVIAGVAVETEIRQNPVTEARFHWVLIQTTGGTVDVVADQEIMSGPPVPGGLVYGEFWLSGRVLPPDDALALPAV